MNPNAANITYTALKTKRYLRERKWNFSYREESYIADADAHGLAFEYLLDPLTDEQVTVLAHKQQVLVPDFDSTLDDQVREAFVNGVIWELRGLQRRSDAQVAHIKKVHKAARGKRRPNKWLNFIEEDV